MSFEESLDWIIPVFSIISCVNIIGNLIVLTTILSRKSLRTDTNCFIVSLSFSNLIVGIGIVPLTLLQVVKHSLHSHVGCYITPYIELVAICSSGYSILAITIDRYSKIVRNVLSSRKIKDALKSISLVWAWSSVYGLRIFFHLWIKELGTSCQKDDERNSTSPVKTGRCNDVVDEDICDIFLEFHSYNLVLRLLDYIILIVIPFAAMIFLYVKLIPKVWGEPITGPSVRSKRAIVKFLIIEVILFVGCWSPLFLFAIIVDSLHLQESELTSERTENNIHLVAVILAFLNSVANPIMYGFFNSNFRKELRKIFHSCHRQLKGNGLRIEPVTIDLSRQCTDHISHIPPQT